MLINFIVNCKVTIYTLLVYGQFIVKKLLQVYENLGFYAF